MNKEIIELVKNCQAWKENHFTLANLISAMVKEECAKVAEAATDKTPEEIAALIRAIN